MAKPKSEDISRRDFIGVSIGAAVLAGVGCGNDEPSPQQPGTGGTPGNGGANSGTGTTAPSSGGAASSNGGASSSNVGNGGANATGGVTGTTGTNTGGATTGNGGATGAQGGSTASQGGNTATTGSSVAKGGATGTTGTTSAKGGSSQGGAANGGSSAGPGGSSAKAGSSPGGSTAKGGTSSTGGSSSSSAPTGSPIVYMARNTDVAAATLAAIAGVGGLPDLTGKVVVIRPNVIEGKADGTTNPEVIRGVIRAAKAKNAKQIIVAEDAFNGGVLTFMETLGITAVCTAEGATPTELKGTATTNRKPANAAAWTNGLDFYDTVFSADYLINVPRCKTHGLANFSMALKAYFGCIKRPASNELHASIHNKCAEAHLVKQEDFVVLDATRCMVTGGPGAGGTMKDSNIVVASKDAIASDVTGLAIIRYFGGTTAVTTVRNTLPWEQGQIKRALALKYPGWLAAAEDFAYDQSGVTEHADIMAKRTA